MAFLTGIFLSAISVAIAGYFYMRKTIEKYTVFLTVQDSEGNRHDILWIVKEYENIEDFSHDTDMLSEIAISGAFSGCGFLGVGLLRNSTGEEEFWVSTENLLPNK